MPGNYSRYFVVSPGDTITAENYNGEFDAVRNNFDPDGLDDASANLAAMQATADPGESGTESLPTSLRGELQRLRFAILELKQFVADGITFWYETPVTAGGDLVGGPGESVDNTIPRYNGTSGNSLQQSGVTISDQDEVVIPITVVTTSSSNTSFTATSATDGTAWDLSDVRVGDIAEASGGSTGEITAIDDGNDSITVSSWVGGTPAGAEVVTIMRRGNLTVEGSLTIGDGTGTATDAPQITVNTNTGDAGIRLQVGNSSSTAWDILVDNSVSDRLLLKWNGSEVARLNTDGTFISAAGVQAPYIQPTDDDTSAPAANRLYKANVPKAWAYLSAGGGGSVTIQDNHNISSASWSGSSMTVNIDTNMANTTYAVITENFTVNIGLTAPVASYAVGSFTVSRYVIGSGVTSNYVGNEEVICVVFGDQ